MYSYPLYKRSTEGTFVKKVKQYISKDKYKFIEFKFTNQWVATYNPYCLLEEK